MQPAGTSVRDASRLTDCVPVRTYSQIFAARPDQVRAARRFMTGILAGCPVAADMILCLSELAANAVIHSSSSLPGGAFAVRAEILDGCYVRIEVHDDGGPWQPRAHHDGRPHGLDIVASLAAQSGVYGGALTGWISWVRFDWPGSDPGQPPAAGLPDRSRRLLSRRRLGRRRLGRRYGEAEGLGDAEADGDGELLGDEDGDVAAGTT